MLDHYHLLINTLNEAEITLLDDHSQELLRVFRSGYKRLNWNSLGNGSQSPYGLLYSYFLCVICASKRANVHTRGRVSNGASVHASVCV